MPSAELLLSFESPMELAFKQLLTSAGIPRVYESRSILEMETPWCEVLFTAGNVTGQAARVNPYRTQAAGALMYIAWESRIEFTIRTQRQKELAATYHKEMIGKVRYVCRMPYLAAQWEETNASLYWTVADIRETGTSVAVDDENDLDITTMGFSIRHGIKPTLEITE